VAGFVPDIENAVTNVTASPFQNGKGWHIRGDTTSGTDLVAKFSRSIYLSKGSIVAKHIRLDVDEYYQYGGYAKSLLAASFTLYKRLGVAYVELDAVGDGLLVWSKFGWSLHGPSISEVHSEIVYSYSQLHAERPPDDFALPLYGPDLLELEDFDGNRIGEQTMINLARSHREVSMRLYMNSDRSLAELAKRGIVF